MAYNKVTLYGNTLIDLTSDSVTAETLADGVTAHSADGLQIVGIGGFLENDYTLLETITLTSAVSKIERSTDLDGKSLDLKRLLFDIYTPQAPATIGCYLGINDYSNFLLIDSFQNNTAARYRFALAEVIGGKIRAYAINSGLGSLDTVNRLQSSVRAMTGQGVSGDSITYWAFTPQNSGSTIVSGARINVYGQWM